MPRETVFKTFTEGGPTYRCTPLHALDASHLALELVQKLGPTLVAVLFDIDGEYSDLDKIRLVLNDGLLGLDRATHDRLLFSFLRGVQTEGMTAAQNLGIEKEFNAHFDNVGLTAAYRAFFWSLEVNVRHYFADALSLVSTLMQQAKARAPQAQKDGTSPE